MKKKSGNKKVVFIMIILVVCIGIFLYVENKNVKKVLSAKYDNIICLDKYCNSILTYQEQNKKTNVTILNKNGKKIGEYKYDNSKKNNKEPFYASDNYILAINKNGKKNDQYSINTNSMKEKYKTTNNLSSINEKLILETKKADIDYEYNILNSSGKKIIKNIVEFESFNDGKILFATKDTHNYIISESGEVLLDGYTVEESKDDYLILKSAAKTTYYYFNIKKSKIINEGFSSYIINNDNTISVMRNINNIEKVYKITKSGKEQEESSSKYLYTVIKKLQKKLESKNYYVYSDSIIDENTNNVFVDNKNNNSFGIYNVKNNKYNKLYSYLTSVNGTELNILNSLDGKKYFQISCSKPICLEPKLYVYSYEQNKFLFKNEGSDKYVTEYHQYKNGYKVVKYSSKDSEYKDNYVLYSDKNEELIKSKKYITVVDSTLVIGKKSKKTLLYSSKENKMINSDNNLAKLVNKEYYLYDNKLIDKNGKEIYSSKKDSVLKYYNNFVYSIINNKIFVYNIDENKESSYKLTNKESSTNKIVIYKSYLLINNNEKNYIKLIDMKTNKIQKIDNQIIFNVKANKNNTRKYLITNDKENSKYGLYILK